MPSSEDEGGTAGSLEEMGDGGGGLCREGEGSAVSRSRRGKCQCTQTTCKAFVCPLRDYECVCPLERDGPWMTRRPWPANRRTYLVWQNEPRGVDDSRTKASVKGSMSSRTRSSRRAAAAIGRRDASSCCIPRRGGATPGGLERRRVVKETGYLLRGKLRRLVLVARQGILVVLPRLWLCICVCM